VSVDGGICMERKAVDGEAPLAFGKRDFFVISKAFSETPHIMTNPWTERDLAGYGMDCSLVKCAVFLKEEFPVRVCENVLPVAAKDVILRQILRIHNLKYEGGVLPCKSPFSCWWRWLAFFSD
jgi:hypothetical protein